MKETTKARHVAIINTSGVIVKFLIQTAVIVGAIGFITAFRLDWVERREILKKYNSTHNNNT